MNDSRQTLFFESRGLAMEVTGQRIVGGITLKPASEVSQPVEKSAERPVEKIPESDVLVQEVDTCPNCGSELVAGECWEC